MAVCVSIEKQLTLHDAALPQVQCSCGSQQYSQGKVEEREGVRKGDSCDVNMCVGVCVWVGAGVWMGAYYSRF